VKCGRRLAKLGKCGRRWLRWAVVPQFSVRQKKQIEVHKMKEDWELFYAFLHPATRRLRKVERDTVDILLPIFDEYQTSGKEKRKERKT
jgi:hypothetical protein